jgi:hypothetical protein
MKHRIWTVAAAAILAGSACSHQPVQSVYAGVMPAVRAPASPAIGRTYSYHLSVRCGIDYAFFAGHWWQADKPLPVPRDAHGYPYAYGTNKNRLETHIGVWVRSMTRQSR